MDLPIFINKILQEKGLEIHSISDMYYFIIPSNIRYSKIPSYIKYLNDNNITILYEYTNIYESPIIKKINKNSYVDNSEVFNILTTNNNTQSKRILEREKNLYITQLSLNKLYITKPIMQNIHNLNIDFNVDEYPVKYISLNNKTIYSVHGHHPNISGLFKFKKILTSIIKSHLYAYSYYSLYELISFISNLNTINITIWNYNNCVVFYLGAHILIDRKFYINIKKNRSYKSVNEINEVTPSTSSQENNVSHTHSNIKCRPKVLKKESTIKESLKELTKLKNKHS